VHAGSKSFVLLFREALCLESAQYSVHVIAVCPGPVATYFFERIASKPPPQAISPERVVSEILRAFDRKQAVRQPAINMQIAQAYLQHGDPALAKRTWQEVTDAMFPLKTGPTQSRWKSAMRDKSFDLIRSRKLRTEAVTRYLKTRGAN
jgi:NAD(P)-dependent dehydrogenase (short-subunit alcohol dehydrogenase family)